METKDISPVQYAKWYGCSTQNITKHIRNNKWKNLPHILRVKNWSRFYLLEVPKSLTKQSFTENKPIRYKKGT